MRKNVLNLFLLLMAAATLVSCATKITGYSMVSPVSKPEPVYEDADVRAAVSIIDSRKYRLEITNKTAGPVRIFWDNSAAVRPDGEEEKLSYKVMPDDKVRHSGEVTVIEPGATVTAEAYPASNAARNRKGVETLRTLDYGGGKKMKIRGKDVGVRLLMEINRSARLYRLLLKIEG